MKAPANGGIVDGSRDGAHARRQDGGHEAAVALDQAGRTDRLSGDESAADDGADHLVHGRGACVTGATDDEISGSRLLRPAAPDDLAWGDDLAQRQIDGGDEDLDGRNGRRRRSDLLRGGCRWAAIAHQHRGETAGAEGDSDDNDLCRLQTHPTNPRHATGRTSPCLKPDSIRERSTYG